MDRFVIKSGVVKANPVTDSPSKKWKFDDKEYDKNKCVHRFQSAWQEQFGWVEYSDIDLDKENGGKMFCSVCKEFPDINSLIHGYLSL